MKLTIELVPWTCWFSDVRSQVEPADWEILRKATLAKAGHRCEVCGRQVTPLHCHEVWEYDDVKHIQKLVKLQALCSACHEVKHIELAQIKGRFRFALRHMAKVNDITEEKADGYENRAMDKYQERSKHEWTLDLSWLKERGITWKERTSG